MIEVMFRIRPNFFFFMPGTKARAIRNGPVRFTARISFHSARVKSSIALRLLMPALLMSMSQTPSFSSTCWATSPMPVSSVTSDDHYRDLAALACDFGGHIVQQALIARDERHRGAGAGKRYRHLPAQTLAGAGDRPLRGLQD